MPAGKTDRKDTLSVEVCLIVISEDEQKEEIISFLTDVSGQLYVPRQLASKDSNVSATLKQIREKNFLPHSFNDHDVISKISCVIDDDNIYPGKEKGGISIVFVDYSKNKIQSRSVKWLNAEEIFEMNEVGKIDIQSWYILKTAIFPQ